MFHVLCLEAVRCDILFPLTYFSSVNVWGHTSHTHTICVGLSTEDGVERPVDESLCPDPKPLSVQSCHTDCNWDCSVSQWTSWSPCQNGECSSSTIDHIRRRHIRSEGQAGENHHYTVFFFFQFSFLPSCFFCFLFFLLPFFLFVSAFSSSHYLIPVISLFLSSCNFLLFPMLICPRGGMTERFLLKKEFTTPNHGLRALIILREIKTEVSNDEHEDTSTDIDNDQHEQHLKQQYYQVCTTL